MADPTTPPPTAEAEEIKALKAHYEGIIKDLKAKHLAQIKELLDPPDKDEPDDTKTKTSEDDEVNAIVKKLKERYKKY